MSARPGEWPSPLSAQAVAAAGLRLAQPSVHGAHSYWLEGRPAEGGRVVLRRADRAARSEDLSPPDANVRTRLHEYGGGAFLACDAGLFFVDDDFAGDAGGGQLLRLERPGIARPLTAAPGLRFADLDLDATRARLVAVCSDARRDAHRPRHSLVAIALADGALTELAGGRGFYASPRVSPDGATLAFLAWDLPDMPWDAAELWTLALDDGAPARRAAAGVAFQPTFAPDGALWCALDDGERFTLQRRAADVWRAFPDGAREHALPLWNLGMRSFGCLDAQTVVAAGVADGLWRLARLDARTGAWTPLAPELTQVDHVHAADGRAVLLAGGPTLASAVVELDPRSGVTRVLARSLPLELDAGDLAAPTPLAIPTPAGLVHALWWAPRNARCALAPGERPPLLVRCHGGPTAAAGSALDAKTLFWTTRGFAVLDVNYRGSWGYGRGYRHALDGGWGERDAEDAVAAARWAIATGRADAARVAITGASAGGLTALNALTLPEQPFRSAGVHYGLTELASAMNDTHMFEAGYGERLIGPWPATRARYEQRSPLARLDRLATPVLLLQGRDDRVVPPDQTERIAHALAARGVRVETRFYEGEGHGFRRADTVADALARELAFHARSFGLAATADAA